VDDDLGHVECRYGIGSHHLDDLGYGDGIGNGYGSEWMCGQCGYGYGDGTGLGSGQYFGGSECVRQQCDAPDVDYLIGGCHGWIRVVHLQVGEQH
jgi:hypothetical protein